MTDTEQHTVHPPAPAVQSPTPPVGEGGVGVEEPQPVDDAEPSKADEAIGAKKAEEPSEGIEAKVIEAKEPGEVMEAEEASEVEEDIDELMATAAQRDEYLALAQRTQADFENYRKRVARESALAQERGVVKLAREVLPALDSLDRALEGAAEDDPLLDGVRLVRAELGAALGRVGIEPFTPVGETFDPSEHEAVVQQPVEGAPSGSVAEVYQTGYRLNGTVIRPARVLVAA